MLHRNNDSHDESLTIYRDFDQFSLLDTVQGHVRETFHSPRSGAMRRARIGIRSDPKSGTKVRYGSALFLSLRFNERIRLAQAFGRAHVDPSSLHHRAFNAVRGGGPAQQRAERNHPRRDPVK